MLYEKVYAFIDNSWLLLNDIKDLKIDGGTLEHFLLSIAPLRIERIATESIQERPYILLEFDNHAILLSQLFSKYEK